MVEKKDFVLIIIKQKMLLYCYMMLFEKDTILNFSH